MLDNPFTKEYREKLVELYKEDYGAQRYHDLMKYYDSHMQAAISNGEPDSEIAHIARKYHAARALASESVEAYHHRRSLENKVYESGYSAFRNMLEELHNWISCTNGVETLKEKYSDVLE